MRKAFSYIRFSTPEQLKGDSLRRQISLSDGYCKRHKLHLDDSLNLRDLGRSAFRGGNAETGALSAFLAAVKSERIPSGSVLIVENLDRLTRNEIGEALSLFISFLNAGIHIVTLSPELEYTKKSINEIGVILQAVLQLFLGHEESAKKSGRLSEAWEAKRAAIGKRKITGKCPFWLKLADDKSRFEVLPERVEVVKRLFALSKQGNGGTAISRRLNEDGIPSPYGRQWNNVSVLAVLKSPAVIGQFTPHQGRAGHRAPVSAPVKGYYPPVIPEAEFYATQAAIGGRKQQRGPRGKYVRNLFTGLLRDARDGTPLHVIEKRPGDVRLISSGAMRGQDGARYVSFPLADFERAILYRLREIDPRSLSADDAGADALAELESQLLRVAAKRTELEAELLNGESASVAKVLRTVEARERELAEQVTQARERAATPLAETWKDTQSLLSLPGITDDPELRLRLRSVLRRAVEEVRVLIVARGRTRIAAVQMWFAGGKSHRDYFVMAGTREPRSIKGDVAPGDFDLRSAADVRNLEKALTATGLAAGPDACE
jgi:DNA invertase Pin-like site-specific DNA recombinase